eukprot:TRINITY_DN11577_c0_g1_i1.p1 TRINITY_DN11577_c0_g1~~TRINITY_DN11577_c0_g1_i1.p1  ORF type:complete len:108 (+),score=15.23 TRINITY_DN11577_c0_g1_i1:211-534(+)
MIRASQLLLVGVEGNIFMSAVKDKRYLDHRLAVLGKETTIQKKPPLSEEELKRFTTSIGSGEALLNKNAGMSPTGVVDEKTGVEIGSAYPNPTRFGDWEVNGRCYDF